MHTTSSQHGKNSKQKDKCAKLQMPTLLPHPFFLNLPIKPPYLSSLLPFITENQQQRKKRSPLPSRASMDAHKSSGAKLGRGAKEEHQQDMIMLNKPFLDQDQEEEKKLASPTSSPSHEFSFTISLHPAGAPGGGRDLCRATSPAPAASFAIDLSPADDIFFHGHLLPLHLLSHISSTTSCDSDVHSKPTSGMAKKKLPNSSNSFNSPPAPSIRARGSGSPVYVTRVRSKPKSFSLFRLSKWRRPLHHREEKEKDEEEEGKTKAAAGFDVGRALKRYAKVVRTPLLLFRAHGEKAAGEKSDQLRRQPHSFSNGSNSRWKELGGERRRRGGGQFSAPASTRTSPTNSGLLVATATISSPNDGTMEELQSAIQAAIAHCKNSIAAQEDKCKS